MADTITVDRTEARYRGLRMTADEYLALPEDGYRYELVDGVVCLSPSPTFGHQKIGAEITRQIANFLVKHTIGEVVHAVDVRLNDNLVYCPDVVYLRNERAKKCDKAVTEVPDLVVEVISPDSRNYDSQTKRADYEAAGVGEYWLIDPEKGSIRFLVLEDGRFHEATTTGNQYASTVLAGLQLELDRVRRLF